MHIAQAMKLTLYVDHCATPNRGVCILVFGGGTHNVGY